MAKIIKFTVEDVRFPTSKDLTGSDAIHTDPDYSATYVTVYTDDPNLKGFGIAFTIGKGNDIVAECIKHFFYIFEDMFIYIKLSIKKVKISLIFYFMFFYLMNFKQILTHQNTADLSFDRALIDLDLLVYLVLVQLDRYLSPILLTLLF